MAGCIFVTQVEQPQLDVLGQVSGLKRKRYRFDDGPVLIGIVYSRADHT
ncbi:hypothetical protein [Pseudomonas viridiflava]|nr:hypothetical protein [Pseudomonas viridiflava]